MPNEWHNPTKGSKVCPSWESGVLIIKSSSFFNRLTKQDMLKEMDMTMSKLPFDRQQIVNIDRGSTSSLIWTFHPPCQPLNKLMKMVVH